MKKCSFYVIKKVGQIDPIIYLYDRLNNYLWGPRIESAERFKSYDETMSYLLTNSELNDICDIEKYDLHKSTLGIRK